MWRYVALLTQDMRRHLLEKRPREVHEHGRRYIHHPLSVGDALADRVTSALGSWPFIGVHVLWFAVWLLLRLDINLLTLIVSLEAIFLSAFVMMSQNRSGAKDHVRDDHEAQEVDELYQINEAQMEILALLKERQQPVTSIIPPDPPSSSPALVKRSHHKKPVKETAA